jgi:hypothetical protein
LGVTALIYARLKFHNSSVAFALSVFSLNCCGVLSEQGTAVLVSVKHPRCSHGEAP